MAAKTLWMLEQAERALHSAHRKISSEHALRAGPGRRQHLGLRAHEARPEREARLVERDRQRVRARGGVQAAQPGRGGDGAREVDVRPELPVLRADRHECAQATGDLVGRDLREQHVSDTCVCLFTDRDRREHRRVPRVAEEEIVVEVVRHRRRRVGQERRDRRDALVRSREGAWAARPERERDLTRLRRRRMRRARVRGRDRRHRLRPRALEHVRRHVARAQAHHPLGHLLERAHRARVPELASRVRDVARKADGRFASRSRSSRARNAGVVANTDGAPSVRERASDAGPIFAPTVDRTQGETRLQKFALDNALPTGAIAA